MNKQIKRWLSLFLVITICFSIGPFLKLNITAKASDDEPDDAFCSGTYQNYEYSGYNRKYAIGEPDYSKIPDDWAITISNYSGNEKNVTIPKKIDGKPVVYISSAFKNNETLQSVTIPNTVEMILDESFQGCKNLDTVTFEDKSILHSIESNAFSDCPNLRTITIPKSVDSISCDTNPISDYGYTLDYSAFSGSGLTTIYGYSGSAAEEYANNKNITFIAISDSSNGNSNNSQNGKKIAIYCSNPTYSLIRGQVLTLAFQIEVNGVQDGIWRQMAITNSDPTVISVETIQSSFDQYTYVTARKAGTSSLTISDPSSGISRTIQVKVTDPSSPRMYPIRMPSDSHFEINGMVLDSYSCAYDKTKNKYVIHMDAYNYNYFSGAIDVYDSNGKYCGSEEIKSKDRPSNLNKFNVYYFLYLPSDKQFGLDNTYKGQTVTKHTSLSFEVPQGGYFTISNNYLDSTGTYIYNSVDLAYEIMKCGKKVTKAFQKPEMDDAIDDTKEKIMEKIKAREDLLKYAQKKAQKICKDYAKKGLSNEEAIDVGQNLLKIFSDYLFSMNIDIKKEMIKSVNKFIQKDLLGACVEYIEWFGERLLFPPGTKREKAKDLFFDANKADVLVHKLLQYFQSKDNPYIFFYTDDYSQNAHNAGILVKTNNNVSSNVKVQAFRVYSMNQWKSFTKKEDYDDLINNSVLYNISLIENDKTVQPSGKVQVQIPVPVGLRNGTCYIYREEDDGTWTQLHANVVGNYLSFETDHFSLYAITGEPETLTIKSLPNKLDYNCFDSLDTSGLELQLGDTLVNDGFLCSPQLMTESGELEITVSVGCAETSFKVNVKKNGFILDEDGITRYYNADKVDTSLTDIKKDNRTNIWFNVVNGIVTPGPTIAKNAYGWWYIDEDGKVDFTANGIYKNQYGWWKTTDGKVTFKETGVFKNEYGWWRVKDSKVDFKANGIYKNNYGWWKTTDGKVTFKENGVFKNEYGWWKVKNSKVDFGYTGVAKNDYGWWRIEKGKVNFKFTGIAKNEYGQWYIKNGKVDFKKNGKVKYNGKTYRVTNGKAKLA